MEETTRIRLFENAKLTNDGLSLYNGACTEIERLIEELSDGKYSPQDVADVISRAASFKSYALPTRFVAKEELFPGFGPLGHEHPDGSLAEYHRHRLTYHEAFGFGDDKEPFWFYFCPGCGVYRDPFDKPYMGADADDKVL